MSDRDDPRSVMRPPRRRLDLHTLLTPVELNEKIVRSGTGRDRDSGTTHREERRSEQFGRLRQKTWICKKV